MGYSQSESNIIASIARYHRKTLPKKRHESWQSLMSKEDKTLVLEMSLILRLAASLDQRPENVISSIKIKLLKNILSIELIPFNSNQELLLEKWSLESCRNVVRELKNLELKICNGEELKVKDNSFDFYTISFGLRNTADIEKTISEAYLVLKKGGRFFCL